MSDQQILDSIDFIHESGLGRGGYRIVLSPSSQLYSDDLIIESFDGEYVNPVGPFRKWVKMDITVYSSEKEYWLFYKTEFWEKCSEQTCLDQYIRPFFYLLREFVEGRVDTRKIEQSNNGFDAVVRDLDSLNKERFPRWIKSLQEQSSR